MEGQILQVVISDLALKSLEQIYDYGSETFSFAAATVFIEQLILRIDRITLSRIEVLNVLHSSRSISNIKAVRKVRI